MKLRFPTVCSLAVNVFIVAMLARTGLRARQDSPSENPALPPGEAKTEEFVAPSHDIQTQVPTNPFAWSELRTQPLAAYRDDLKDIGCPDHVIQNILTPLVHEPYAEKSRKLMEPFIQRFWEMTCPPVGNRLVELQVSLDRLQSEENLELQQLFKGLSPEPNPIDDNEAAADAQLSFLSPDLQERVRDLIQSNQERLREIQQFQFRRARNNMPVQTAEPEPSDPEWEKQLQELVERQKTLNDELDGQLAALLTPEELTELRLRQSQYAEIRDLEGVDLSSEELIKIIQLREGLNKINETNAQAPAKIETDENTEVEKLLGEKRFKDFQLAQDPDYQSLLQASDRLGMTQDQIQEVWLKRGSLADAAEKLMNFDDSMTHQQRQQALDGLRAEASKLLGGEDGESVWNSLQKDWMDRTFTLPQPDPWDPPGNSSLQAPPM